MRITLKALIITLPLMALAGCDGWPTSFENLTGQSVRMSYWHAAYDQRSATFEFKAGQRTLLARELRLRNFTEVRVWEGDREHVFTGPALDRLKAACPGYRRELIYHGAGVLTARPFQAQPRSHRQ